jgi:hypothetical protein
MNDECLAWQYMQGITVGWKREPPSGAREGTGEGADADADADAKRQRSGMMWKKTTTVLAIHCTEAGPRVLPGDIKETLTNSKLGKV